MIVTWVKTFYKVQSSRLQFVLFAFHTLKSVCVDELRLPSQKEQKLQNEVNYEVGNMQKLTKPGVEKQFTSEDFLFPPVGFVWGLILLTSLTTLLPFRHSSLVPIFICRRPRFQRFSLSSVSLTTTPFVTCMPSCTTLVRNLRRSFCLQ